LGKFDQGFRKIRQPVPRDIVAKDGIQSLRDFFGRDEPRYAAILLDDGVTERQGRIGNVAAANVKKPCDRGGIGQDAGVMILFEKFYRDEPAFFGGALSRIGDVMGEDRSGWGGGAVFPNGVYRICADGEKSKPPFFFV
jgi:hypothetical protein